MLPQAVPGRWIVGMADFEVFSDAKSIADLESIIGWDCRSELMKTWSLRRYLDDRLPQERGNHRSVFHRGILPFPIYGQ